MPHNGERLARPAPNQRALHRMLEDRRQSLMDQLEQLKVADKRRTAYRSVTTLLNARYRAAGMAARPEILDTAEFMLAILSQV